MVKTHVIRLRGAEGRDAGDQIAFCAFHSFLVEVQTNAGQSISQSPRYSCPAEPLPVPLDKVTRLWERD